MQYLMVRLSSQSRPRTHKQKAPLQGCTAHEKKICHYLAGYSKANIHACAVALLLGKKAMEWGSLFGNELIIDAQAHNKTWCIMNVFHISVLMGPFPAYYTTHICYTRHRMGITCKRMILHRCINKNVHPITIFSKVWLSANKLRRSPDRLMSRPSQSHVSIVC